MSLAQDIRHRQRQNIRRFLEEQGEYLRGKVLDYGCGKRQYEDTIREFATEYVPYDTTYFPGSISEENYPGVYDSNFDAVVSTQVIHLVNEPISLLNSMRDRLFINRRRSGYLLMTYPVNWPHVEMVDRWRWTRTGMNELLEKNGWEIILHKEGTKFTIDDLTFELENHVVARAV